MARLSLNKAQLAREIADLAMYRRFLPSLDLKRQQLMAERKKAQARLGAIEAEVAAQITAVGAQIPMLADKTIDLAGLATIRSVTLGERNVVGQKLPVLEALEVEILPYGYLARPHWVDLVAERLKNTLQLRIEARIVKRQLTLLDIAITKVTQRVNLFDKVLIPRATTNIRRIQIALGDLERAAVVTSKIAKRKREAAAS